MDWALFIPLLCLLLLLFLPVPALDTNGDDSSAPTSNPCCEKKTVGSVPYTLVDEADTSNYNCRSNCVYERDDIPGEGRFCFREGQFDVVCNGGPGQGAGKPPFSDPRSAFGFLNGQCIFEQGHSCVEYDQLLPHSKDFDNNSPQLCMDYCREKGYSIAGVAYTKECWCGDTEPTEEQFAPAADCNSFCNGDITQFCGSACRMNVYTIPGNHLPEVFTKPGEFDIQRGNEVTQLEFLGEEFVLSFDLLLTNLDSGGYFSILHLTTGADSGAYGDRTPAVWLIDREFHIASAISGDINEFKHIILNPPLRTNTWMRFEISQLISNNKHIFRVRVDGKLYWEIENNAPTMFPAVTIFGSDDWYKPASGKIRNIKVRTSVLCLQPHPGCTIHLSPLATWIRAPRDECLKACSESDGCEAMSLTIHDAGNVCRFHGLTKDESGPHFKCGPEYSDSTVYFKKLSYVSDNYHFIRYGKLLEEKGNTLSQQQNLQNLNIVAWDNGNYLLQHQGRWFGWLKKLWKFIKPKPVLLAHFDWASKHSAESSIYVNNIRNSYDPHKMPWMDEHNDEMVSIRDRWKGGIKPTDHEIIRLALHESTDTDIGRRNVGLLRHARKKHKPSPPNDDQEPKNKLVLSEKVSAELKQAMERDIVLSKNCADNPLDEPTTLYRHLHMFVELFDIYVEGKTMTTQTTESWTGLAKLDPKLIDPDELPFNVRLEITTDKACSVSDSSKHRDQDEYHIGRDRTLRVVSITKSEIGEITAGIITTFIVLTEL